MDDEEAELRNPFPSPPSHYTRYTTHNLALLALLNERVAPIRESSAEPASLAADALVDLSGVNQYEVLVEQSDLPDWPLAQLRKPRVDWILEEGHYTVFGDTWYIKETIPSLAESGGHQLYPADPSVDRRPALRAILRSMLVTYSHLLNALLAPPPTNSTPPDLEPEWKRHLEWINVLAQNIMAAANDLRPVQARGNLELMMRRQLELRRAETQEIHAKCDALEAQLAQMREVSLNMATATPAGSSSGQAEGATSAVMAPPSIEDVLRWAEEIQ